MSAPKEFADLPKYEDLPNIRRYWPYAANSDEEAMGMLGLMTPKYIAASANSEIRTGERICITQPLQEPREPFFGRKKFKLDISFISYPLVFDDVLTLNPQSGSQWDGLRHHSQPISYDPSISKETIEALDLPDRSIWYGGTKSSEIVDNTTLRIGIHKWAQKGIIGRGVLLDYAAYAEARGIKYNCFEHTKIPLSSLLEIAQESKIEFKPGDILCIRTGTTTAYRNLDEDSLRQAVTPPTAAIGIEQTPEMFKWIWDRHFPVLVSDSLAVEAFPAQDPEWSIHRICIAGWGLALGELFDLDELALHCKKLNRYTFFFNSVPLNTLGGVSSPPNAVAIF
ncbi:uncharacterized protein V1516DRAFT_679189 [Lipomyces oligophaga]|uniref:uncharacterized protein n=1 Tax=Lipomyces oligophaga TaxID=45792 RepID=UPI0034CE4450